MYCSGCGKELKNEWIKCPYCGKGIKEVEAVEPTVSVGPTASIEAAAPVERAIFNNGEKIKHRQFWKYLLLSSITFGIYGIYVLYGYVKDVNKICEGDEKESPNYILVVLLSVVTLGIYGLYWWYTQGKRIYEAAPKYGVEIRENGSTILVWEILGYTLMLGVGLWVAIYIMFDNVNRIALSYNQEMTYAALQKMEKPHPHLIRNVIIIYAVCFALFSTTIFTIISSIFLFI